MSEYQKGLVRTLLITFALTIAAMANAMFLALNPLTLLAVAIGAGMMVYLFAKLVAS